MLQLQSKLMNEMSFFLFFFFLSFALIDVDLDLIVTLKIPPWRADLSKILNFQVKLFIKQNRLITPFEKGRVTS